MELHCDVLRAAFAAGFLIANTAVSAADTSRPRPPFTGQAQRIEVAPLAGGARAVVVKSWGACLNGAAWATLNSDWRNYGAVPVQIDYDDPLLCGNVEVTYDALVASGAQTVIISDPSGGGGQFNADEVDALTRYAQEGHDLIGTYLLLAYPDSGVDNRILAPLFGLDPDAHYDRAKMHATHFEIRAGARLFEGMDGSYVTEGFESSQTPPNRKWTKNRIGQTRFMGRNDDATAAILEYCGPGYRATWFTSMPEYSSGVADLQVLYNAIVMGRTPGCKAD